jgi:hypothetical protein
MKKILMGAAAALAIAAPAHAAVGYVGANYATGDVDPGGLDADAWGVEGAVAFDVSAGLGAALDASYSDSDDLDSTTAGTAHLFFKNDQRLLGGFVGAADTSNIDVWDAGLEGQFFLDNTTLGAAVTYANSDDVNTDGWGVNGSARYFVNDNFAIGGNVGWFSLDAGALDADAWIAGVGAEYQLASTPVSFTGGYSHYDADDIGATADVFTIGVRYNFNGTLKDRNHAGGDVSALSGVSALRF